jgi:hypothetical protein
VKGLAHPGDTIHFSVEAEAEKLSLLIEKATEETPAKEVKSGKKASKKDEEPTAEATADEDLEGK